MRLVIVSLTAAAALAVPGVAAAATPTGLCPQSDPSNGLRSLRAGGGITCAKAFGVAKRTNSVKCFLNGNTCTHTYRGRNWRCVLRGGSRVTCKSGGRVVKYRLG